MGNLLSDRVGGGVTPAVLPQHLTYGSVYGGSCLLGIPPQRASFRSSCRLSSNRRRHRSWSFRLRQPLVAGPELPRASVLSAQRACATIHS
ncbi:hypothetical protein F6X40_22250 [Paraburkholderia sp. UCT31]|nr:hypothetical protein [Paraburkholderia sp. UCT31]